MQMNHFAKSAFSTFCIVAGFFACWEWYLRSKGIKVDYDDGKELWAHKRKQVYQGPGNATVFIGASRIKHGLDIETWRKQTGEDAVQLAVEGSTFLPVLSDLANDEKFKGKLVIDISESFLFNLKYYYFSKPTSFIGYYQNETFAEKAGFWLNRVLESNFVFLDKNNLSLNAFFEKIPLKKRQGVIVVPPFPMGFCRVSADRQNIMTDQFLADSNQLKWVLNNLFFLGGVSRNEPVTQEQTDSILTVIKNDVDKIRARGGRVVMVRTPASGLFWETEKKTHPRNLYWDRLASFVAVPAIHFEDYPELSGFNCPDYSHLAPKDARIFTEKFIDLLKQKGWSFGKQATFH